MDDDWCQVRVNNMMHSEDLGIQFQESLGLYTNGLFRRQDSRASVTIHSLPICVSCVHLASVSYMIALPEPL